MKVHVLVFSSAKEVAESLSDVVQAHTGASEVEIQLVDNLERCVSWAESGYLFAIVLTDEPRLFSRPEPALMVKLRSILPTLVLYQDEHEMLVDRVEECLRTTLLRALKQKNFQV